MGLFSKENREVLFGWTAVLGAIPAFASLPLLFNDRHWPDDFFWINVIQAALILSLIMLLAVLMRQFDRAVTAKNDSACRLLLMQEELKTIRCASTAIADTTHKFGADLKQILTGMFYDIWSRSGPYQENDKKAAFRSFVQYSLNIIECLFTHLTGSKCAATIKLLKKDQVTTYLRDHNSSLERSVMDKARPYVHISEKSDFSTLMDVSSDQFFLSNDLQNEPGYLNPNVHWKQLYNACIIVPICMAVEAEGIEQGQIIIGFLCVDNKTGGFSEDLGVKILAAFADLYFHLFNARKFLKF